MGNKGLYVQQIGRPVKYDELNSYLIYTNW